MAVQADLAGLPVPARAVNYSAPFLLRAADLQRSEQKRALLLRPLNGWLQWAHKTVGRSACSGLPCCRR
jgi:hypothetical protein